MEKRVLMEGRWSRGGRESAWWWKPLLKDDEEGRREQCLCLEVGRRQNTFL